MNSLTNLISFPSPRKHLLHLLPRTALQQCKFFSAKTTVSSSSHKVQQLTNPKPHKSSESPSSSGFSQRFFNKQTDAAAISVWPEPRKMPYQAKVSNFVNLIGNVEIPIHFEADSDGKHFATTIISVGNGGGRKSPLSIPVVFEGELAHVVACHVKEKNCVFVSGQLSVDPMRLVLGESVGKFHVVAENLSFVEGFEKNVNVVVDKKTGASFSPVEIYNPDKHGIQLSDKEAIERFDDGDEEDGDEKSGEYVTKKKNVDEISDLWRCLVKNPQQWWDYRSHKSNGLVKEKFPDFKQKGTGQSLWVNTAPEWVLTGLGLLEFDVKDLKPKQVMGREGCNERKSSGKLDDSWKNLVENPDKWWDNRTKKKNPKAPDFRHKETGEGLWLDTSPDWALTRIPPA